MQVNVIGAVLQPRSANSTNSQNSTVHAEAGTLTRIQTKRATTTRTIQETKDLSVELFMRKLLCARHSDDSQNHDALVQRDTSLNSAFDCTMFPVCQCIGAKAVPSKKSRGRCLPPMARG